MDNMWKGIAIMAVWGAITVMVVRGDIHSISWVSFWAMWATIGIAES